MSSPDIAIIGAGPAGLFAAFTCGMLGYRSYIFDIQEEFGGQCTLYPEKPIFDIPAYPCITASELIENLKKQHAPFRPEYRLKEQVKSIQKNANGFIINEDILVKAIIIAGGIGAFGPRKPPIDNIEAFENQSVFYSITNKSLFKDKIVAIAGGGDSAVDWALELSKIAKKVYLIHRRSKFRCHNSSESTLNGLIQSGQIILEAPYQVQNLKGENGILSQVILESIQDNSTKNIDCDYFLPFFGLSADLGPILTWNLNLKKDLITVDTATMSSSQPGIYAIGDIVDYPGKQKLIMVGFTEAMVAAHAMRQYLNPDKVFHFEHSTTQGVQPL